MVAVLGLVVAITIVLLVPEATEPLILFAAGAWLLYLLGFGFARRSRKYLLTALIGLGCIAWLLTAAPGALFSSTHLNVDGFFHVSPGMKLEEVQHLLGGGPGNFGKYSAQSGVQTLEGLVGPRGSDLRYWRDDQTAFAIAFVDERVVAKQKRARYVPMPTLLSRLQRILELTPVGPPRGALNFPGGDTRD